MISIYYTARVCVRVEDVLEIRISRLGVRTATAAARESNALYVYMYTMPVHHERKRVTWVVRITSYASGPIHCRFDCEEITWVEKNQRY